MKYISVHRENCSPLRDDQSGFLLRSAAWVEKWRPNNSKHCSRWRCNGRLRKRREFYAKACHWLMMKLSMPWQSECEIPSVFVFCKWMKYRRRTIRFYKQTREAPDFL